MDCYVWNVLSIANGYNKTGRGTGMGCEDGDRRKRKNLPCTEWVNRGEVYSWKGVMRVAVQVLLHTRPRGGRWSVEAQNRQKNIFLPASRQRAVEIITSGWVWETDVGLEMCWRHLWKRHRARLLKSMTQEIPSHNLCRWLIILGRLIMLWACSDLP